MNDNYNPTEHYGASVIAIQEGIVQIKQTNTQPLIKNEIIYICPEQGNVAIKERIMGEVLHVKGDTAIAQVFEDTSGIAIGNRVEQSGEQLSVLLGPGLLGMIYDGLQNPLLNFASKYNYFLPRGVRESALDLGKKWVFNAVVRAGDILGAGSVLGTVQEGRFTHKIMVPFDLGQNIQVDWIQQGTFTVDTPVARLVDEGHHHLDVSMIQKWPVRTPIAQKLIMNHQAQRLYPTQPMITTLRLIDTFFPIARGGTACIPGPFGAGKTVLQNLIARYSDVDIVIIVACGERAGEVVETITEFPKLIDPKSGGTLMDRTIIICNTSSMPVASREASIYTGITLGEYYRQMGFNVLLIADSTSRWAQAMRETSGRMEEIPGEEGFPAYLDSSIRGLYERAGIIECPDNSVGSLTIVGTVSPAGGNFEEPVTQSTLSAVKTFLGLSYDRAYKRYYPAVDPLISWSRYRDQLKSWFDTNLESTWTANVNQITKLLHQGQDILNMMQVTGEEGITMEDYITYQKSLMFDMVYLQQDAYDSVDVSVPLARQKQLFNLLNDIIIKEYEFEKKESARNFFIELMGLLKNLNYSPLDSDNYTNYYRQIIELTKLTV
ncbi:V-type ATP synthase subunit A [Legionella bononiensis]|uniref:V-type ATP synthase alpha chain n=1 Tax=Legionella bononiensis TaxID=2793102 RepID=A0ABS1W6P0_9GAMM|nr:V-type ATP synthase subunit A [Legionella bononiensis]MBL7478435.1 V-type ATP synthase subunit A [Legionella bononiensis]MBL7525032.1 V-type ATP synthase subunit A [Legionella bononiensis]MBL7561328.1 V-type ATP synthase subunit A [Legionella bononiensis]